jgi:PucR family transcriptional regulator, purine catabolism regulatory protein
LLGALSLIVPRGRATPEDAQATTHGAAACAVVLAREQAAATVRREVELHVLDEVLDGALRSEATLLQQARRLGHDLVAPHVALVAHLDQVFAGPVRAQGRDDRWNGLGDVVARVGPGRGARPLWRVRQNHAEIVWPAAAAPDVMQMARAMHAEMSNVLLDNGGQGALRVSLGVGSVRDGIAGIRRSHQEARQALTLGRRLHGAGSLTRFDDLGVHRLIYAAEGLPELRGLYQETLGDLIDYDRQNSAELIHTLDAFFAANGSPKEAAERLGVHRNTVLYRLDRIRDITGYDLDDAATRLRLHLALQIHLALSEE